MSCSGSGGSASCTSIGNVSVVTAQATGLGATTDIVIDTGGGLATVNVLRIKLKWVSGTGTTTLTPRLYNLSGAAAGSINMQFAGTTTAAANGTAGVTAHNALTSISLGWSASDHTGTTNSVACFNDTTGAALNVQATTEGSVLTYTGGVLTFAVFAMTVAYLSEKGYEINYVSAFTDAASSATVVAGTMV